LAPTRPARFCTGEREDEKSDGSPEVCERRLTASNSDAIPAVTPRISCTRSRDIPEIGMRIAV
jgi:hypothetical protein